MSAFIGGTLVADDGTMQTLFLSDVTPVPASAVFVNGFMHAPTGERYVAAWPGSGLVVVNASIASRPDGAMCILSGGTAEVFVKGWGMTARGEVTATASAPQLVLGSIGLQTDGKVSMSAVS